MARRGLRLANEEKAQIIVERESAKKSKDWRARTRLRCLLLCNGPSAVMSGGSVG